MGYRRGIQEIANELREWSLIGEKASTMEQEMVSRMECDIADATAVWENQAINLECEYMEAIGASTREEAIAQFDTIYWLDNINHKERDKMKANDDIQPLWIQEFGAQYEIPEEILTLVDKGLLEDTSWHNDESPSFASPDYILWILHPKASERENVTDSRFYLMTGETENSERGEDVCDGDDLHEVLAVMGFDGSDWTSECQCRNAACESCFGHCDIKGEGQLCVTCTDYATHYANK